MELKSALDQCVRCGRCMSVCPVYRQTGWEGSVARGKLALLRAQLDGETDLAGRMKDLLSHCLLCGACAETCAGGVKADDLIRAGRSLAIGEGGLEKFKSLLLKNLLSQGALAKGLVKGAPLLLKNVPEDSGLHCRFPLPGIDENRWLPRPAQTPFLKRRHDLKRRPRSIRAALFTGCVGNYLTPRTAEATVRLLEAAGAEVIIPKDQVCCGKPAAGIGDDPTAHYLARKNMSVFSPLEFDYLVTFCATCSEHLKAYGEVPGIEGGQGLADKVIPLSKMLGDVLDWQPSIKPGADAGPLRVFYHDPCHLRRKQGVMDPPRKLIAALPGVKLVGSDAPPVCCGYGGAFNLWHYQLSMDLFRHRTETIQQYSPDVVVTTCSGCLLQFEDGVRRLGRPFQVKPLAELLTEKGLG